MITLLKLPTYLIQYRAEQDILLLRWHIEANLLQVQAAYEVLLQTAKDHNCARWLLDLRCRESADQEILAWTSMVFYPLAAKRMQPRHLQLVLLTSPRPQAFVQNGEQELYMSYLLSAHRPYTFRHFEKEHDAERWLQRTFKSG
ncbi:hypothetical protein [Hymenobacter cellulosilyticus]|uniref:STAS/SEC14 domain-containing protein n=1 Tax=Hymenobacter cellulosilyticus TaxID=2932248 RepID=A0A8T9Q1Q3_9BACT|nr:hypothetical protein [Hymenobacter cellulosilyticus]UOQ70955.1 hypothetical protein MUN79_20090 [Hymenobacter cellulosilyticus]